jgi:hypothetical protein
MKLVIKRRFEPDHKLSSGTSWPYVSEIKLDLTDEERELIDRFNLGDHVLSQKQYSMTQLKNVISGIRERTPSLDVLIGNEEVLRSACAALPAMLDFCRSFGSELTVPL